MASSAAAWWCWVFWCCFPFRVWLLAGAGGSPVAGLSRRQGAAGPAGPVPPLSPADQRLGLPALKADLLSQIKSQETSLIKQAGPRVPAEVLIKDSLRVLLLAPLLAIAFAVSARRSTPPPRPAGWLHTAWAALSTQEEPVMGQHLD